MRLCIRAAELRAKSWTYAKIADELGLDTPMAAKKCAETGYGLAPGEDLRMARRRAAEELDLIRRGLWEVVDSPGIKFAANGEIIVDPSTGKAAEDQEARTGALRALIAANKEYRTLFGTDAPKLTASMVATGSVEDIQAQIAAVKREIEESERDAARAIEGARDTVPGVLLPEEEEVPRGG